MVLREQAKDLEKIVFEAGTVGVVFNRWFTSGILNKSIVSEYTKVQCDDLCGQRQRFTE